MSGCGVHARRRGLNLSRLLRQFDTHPSLTPTRRLQMMHRRCGIAGTGLALALLIVPASAAAQSAQVVGSVRDETDAVLAGVSVALRGSESTMRETVTDDRGFYQFDNVG